MRERPDVGARVRLLSNTGLPNVDGRTGKVVAHHADGIAFSVRLDANGERITVDPVNVRPARKVTRERVRASA